MGFGKLSSAATNVQNDFAAVKAANQQNALTGAIQQEQANSLARQQAAAVQESAARDSAKAQVTDIVDSKNQQNNVALGVLDYIRTTSQGLLNSKSNTGKLTILGN